MLSIQSNRIVKLEGLAGLVSLEEFYISHNGIEVVEGLEALTGLTTLDLAANRIKRITGVSHLVKLEEFWVRLLVG